MKLVFLIRTLTFGGAERQLVALANGLHERGNQITVVVFYPGGPLEKDLEAAGIRVRSLDKSGRWDIVGFLLRTARVLREEQPDIVHGYLGASNLLSLLLRPIHRGKSVWGVRASGMDNDQFEWIDRLDGWLEGRFSRFADLVIANSHSGKANAISLGFPARKTIVIPNGIDVDRFQRDLVGRATIRREFGVADDETLIGRVGRIDPQKDYPLFLETSALIAAARPQAKFVCVGSGSDETLAELRALSNQIGIAEKVIWANARPDMPAVYSAMDLSISSSAFGEGTPNVVAEALACGVPTVATDVGDSLIVLGDSAMVVPKRRADLLAEAALRVLAAADAGEIDHGALRARVVNSLSMGALIARSESALESLISGNRRFSRRSGKASA